MIDAEEIISALVRCKAMSPIAAKCARQELKAAEGTPSEAAIHELLTQVHEALLSHAIHGH